jgi:UDP-2,4-diacetamido-2,4,6-trideoxy-beta-L-altropyranose hydrolase
LAAALHRSGVQCVFLTNNDPNVQNRIDVSLFEACTVDDVKSGSSGDLEKTLATVDKYECDNVVVDSYDVDADYLGRLREAGLFVVAIDDLACYPFPCQMVVNGNADAYQLSYVSSSGDTAFLLGPQYSLLNPEFWNMPHRVVRHTVRNVFVTLGGADPYNLTPKLLGLLNNIEYDFSVTAVVGPYFANSIDVEAMVKECRRPVRVIRNPDSLGDLVLESDLAISGGGQTLYELACVGCPTVAVRIAANQEGQLKVFKESGFLRVGGHADEHTIIDTIGDAVLSLLPDLKARAAMSASGRRLIDGKGAMRVAQAILG